MMQVENIILNLAISTSFDPSGFTINVSPVAGNIRNVFLAKYNVI